MAQTQRMPVKLMPRRLKGSPFLTWKPCLAGMAHTWVGSPGRGVLLPLSPDLLAPRNYEQIVKAHQDNPHEGKDQVSDQVKFNVFQGIMDSLFQSFNASISVASFQELSACVFSWIEEHCKPQVQSPGPVRGLRHGAEAATCKL